MLSELYIENLAIIKQTSIKFDMGLNVFTGETGAGKSIVIDAINAVLGQRSSKEIVRHGASKAIITATFSNPSRIVLEKLLQYGYESDDDELMITREISADGKSSARIMGRPVTVGILKEIGTDLINIHGQHDNQILLSPEKHMDILDKCGDFPNLIADYYKCYKRVVTIKREIKKISVDEQEKAQKIDMLTYQIDEIISASLVQGEEEKLLAKQTEARNKAKIIKGLQAAHALLNEYEDESGAIDNCKLATKALEEIVDYYDPSAELFSRLEGLSSELEELSNDIENQIDSFDGEESPLDIIENRLDEIHKLKHKYGDDVEEILNFAKKSQDELDQLELSDKLLGELNQQGIEEYQQLLVLAEQLTRQRSIAAKRFIDTIKSELQFLDMPNVSFEVHRDKVKPNAKGQDNIEFLISTNKGEPPKPIAKIASGGELSRIMLAIKNALADKDEVQTLIFDEIDTGVSGRAAQKIGLKLSQAAQNRQIISVTHLAQIAALADHHFLIQKQSDENNTFTSVTELDKAGRIYEVARIMSTDKISDLMLKNAEEMIDRK